MPQSSAGQTAAEHVPDSAWRKSYTENLVSKGLPASTAAGIAAKAVPPEGMRPPGAEPASQARQLELLSPSSTDQPARASTSRASAKKAARLVDAGAEIIDSRPSGDDLAFFHSILCQVGLPRSKVEGRLFERRSGKAALLVEAGHLWDGKQFVPQPIPYGAMPRLMLAWMNTYAVRFQTPEIPVGSSASEFLRLLGKEATGGKTGTYTAFRTQMQALAACRMILGFNQNGRAHTYEGKPISHFDAWQKSTDEQRPLWPGVVTFSPEYYRTLVDHAVPLDHRALIALQGSALRLDIYVWLAERLHRIYGRPALLHWTTLREQFGQEYQGNEADKDFKKKFLPALHDVLTVYPEAKVKQVTGGILLMPSPPPVPYEIR